VKETEKCRKNERANQCCSSAGHPPQSYELLLRKDEPEANDVEAKNDEHAPGERQQILS
jgi:hypothetical protein